MDSVRAPNHESLMFSFTIASDTQQSMYRTLQWSLDSFYVNVTCTVNDTRISADICWVCFKEQVPHVQLFHSDG